MSVQVENLEKNMAKLTIEVAAEKVEDAIQAAYMKEKGKISVPGFRKGKVPRKMIEKMYGAGVFYEDAANTLIQENYAQAVEESGVDVPRGGLRELWERRDGVMISVECEERVRAVQHACGKGVCGAGQRDHREIPCDHELVGDAGKGGERGRRGRGHHAAD